MPLDERSFDNPYLTSEPQVADSTYIFEPDFKERVVNFIHIKLQTIREQLTSGNISEKDVSIYTGLSGIALLLLKLQRSQLLADKVADDLNELAYSLTRQNERKCSSAITLLCGSPGALLVQALTRFQVKKKNYEHLLKSVVEQASIICTPSSKTYDEFLYGRVGYLGALALMGQYFPDFKDEELIDKVCAAVIESGIKSSDKYRSKQPMVFEWHEKEYVGGAHGYAGIFYYLLKHKRCPAVTKVLDKELKNSLYWFLDLQYESGNYPSSIGSRDDKLVHWCHGAPSAVYTLIAAYEVYGDEKFKKAALACGDCVWKRGFLKKGYGICHGTAGNAYTFLALYRFTNDLKHLYRAACFAELCLAFDKPHRSADRPYSLFEGLAGTMYFLLDMLDYNNALFPCYELS